MKPTTQHLLLGALCLFPLLFWGCKGEPACPDAWEGYEYLPEEYKSILPHKGDEQLLFLTNTHDTIKCIGKGSSTLFDVAYTRNSNPDCGEYNKINHERVYMDYAGFTLEQKRINLTYVIKWIDMSFNFPCTDVGRPYTKFYDSLQVNGTTYLKVSEFASNDSVSRVFMNRTHGVLKLHNKQSNVTWSRID